MATEKKRVLVVDDDAELQQLIQLLLSRIGLEAVQARDASEAAEILKKPPLPSIVILDLMMPDVSGVEFLRQIRAKQAFDHLPVLVLSALVDPERIREALDTGADRYLTKPYLANNLTTIVTEMLRTGRRQKS